MRSESRLFETRRIGWRGAAASIACGAAFVAGAVLGPARLASSAMAQESSPAAGSEAAKSAAIRHIVLIDFKPEADAATIDALGEQTRAFRGVVPGLVSVEWGADVGDGSRADGYDRAILMTFADKASLEGYGPHPAHQALLANAMPLVERLLVFDILAQDPPAAAQATE